MAPPDPVRRAMELSEVARSGGCAWTPTSNFGARYRVIISAVTVQALDSFCFDVETHGVLLTPLGFASSIVESNDRPDRPRLPLEGSTALARGYIAHWAIRDRVLWLMAVHGCLRLVAGQPVPAEWVSAELRIGTGPAPDDLSDAYSANYACQIRLVVYEGLVESAWRMERLW